MSIARFDRALFAAWAHLMAQHTRAILARRTTDDRPVWVEDLETRSGNMYRILITDDYSPLVFVIRPQLGQTPHRWQQGSLCLSTVHGFSMSPLTARTRALAWLENYEWWQSTGRWPEEPHTALSEPPTGRR